MACYYFVNKSYDVGNLHLLKAATFVRTMHVLDEHAFNHFGLNVLSCILPFCSSIFCIQLSHYFYCVFYSHFNVLAFILSIAFDSIVALLNFLLT